MIVGKYKYYGPYKPNEKELRKLMRDYNNLIYEDDTKTFWTRKEISKDKND